MLSTLIEACGQVSLKNAAGVKRERRSRQLWLAAGVLCFATEAVVWSFVLRLLEVSVAYPMSSLSFVAVTFLSWLLLREQVSKERWIGVFLIICGTALVGIG